MARRVFLHIGTMKAATSYLQATLDRNRVRLAESGVLWLGAQRNHHAVNSHLDTSRVMQEDEQAWPHFAKEIRDFEGNAVVSMELLAQARPQKIRSMFRSLGAPDLNIILTARELSRVLPSHWQELTQNRHTEPWSEFVARVCTDDPSEDQLAERFWRHHDLAEIIRRWTAVIPSAETSIITVPRSRADSAEMWRRFSAALGVEVADSDVPRSSNESLGALSAELMRRINREVPELDWPTYRLGFKQRLAKQALAMRSKSEPRLFLPEDRYLWLRERAERMLHEVDELGVRIVGDRTDLEPRAAPSAREVIDPAGASPDMLLETATAGLVGLASGLGADRREALRIEQRADALERENAVLRDELENSALVRWNRRLRRLKLWLIGAGSAARARFSGDGKTRPEGSHSEARGR